MHKSYQYLLAVALLTLTACNSPEEIVVHRIPKPESKVANVVFDDQMLVGVFFQNERAWFFKIVGDEDRVEKQKSAFVTMLENVEFENDEPKWETPDSWTEVANPSRFRRATYKLDDETPELQLAISTFGITEELPEYKLININRWRREMSLDEIQLDEVDEQLQKVKGHDNGYLLELTGAFGGGAMGGRGGPFANMQFNQPKSEDTGSPEEDIKVEVPENWTAGKLTIFSRLSYVLEEADQKIGVTVSPLTKINKWNDNVVRWTGSIKADSLDEQQIAGKSEDFSSGGFDGKWIELISKDEKTILLGAMIVTDNFAWFYKLQGDAELAKKEKAKFRAFVETSKFE